MSLSKVCSIPFLLTQPFPSLSYKFCSFTPSTWDSFRLIDFNDWSLNKVQDRPYLGILILVTISISLIPSLRRNYWIIRRNKDWMSTKVLWRVEVRKSNSTRKGNWKRYQGFINDYTSVLLHTRVRNFDFSNLLQWKLLDSEVLKLRM